MAAIERTAYPQFRRNPVVRELVRTYTPTDAELEFVTERTRQPGHRLLLTVLLKAFQRLRHARWTQPSCVTSCPQNGMPSCCA